MKSLVSYSPLVEEMLRSECLAITCDASACHESSQCIFPGYSLGELISESQTNDGVGSWSEKKKI